MAITVLTAANSTLLTTALAVIEELGGTSSTHFTVIERLIAQASRSIERHCHRTFAQQRYRETVPWQGRAIEIDFPVWSRDPRLFLSRRPVVTIESITLHSTAITDYRVLNAEAGLLWRAQGWGWGIPTTAEDDLTIDYIAGYLLPEQVTPPAPTGEALPDDLERAAIETVKIWFHERVPGERVTARGFGEQRIEYHVSSGRMALPMLARDLLKPWMPIVLV